MQPTQRAESLIERLRPLRDGIGSFEQALSGTDEAIAGTVRITTSQMFGALDTCPASVAPLLREEPLLQIEVQATDVVENLVRREADIAVRFFRPEQDDVITVSLGHTEVGLFAHQSFVDSMPPGVDAGDLKGRYVGDVELQQDAGDRGLDRLPLAALRTSRFRSQSTVGQLIAIEAGIGVGAMLALFAAERPGLRRVFPELRRAAGGGVALRPRRPAPQSAHPARLRPPRGRHSATAGHAACAIAIPGSAIPFRASPACRTRCRARPCSCRPCLRRSCLRRPVAPLPGPPYWWASSLMRTQLAPASVERYRPRVLLPVTAPQMKTVG